MIALKELSDNDLMALYKQQTLSELPDDELINLYNQGGIAIEGLPPPRRRELTPERIQELQQQPRPFSPEEALKETERKMLAPVLKTLEVTGYPARDIRETFYEPFRAKAEAEELTERAKRLGLDEKSIDYLWHKNIQGTATEEEQGLYKEYITLEPKPETYRKLFKKIGHYDEVKGYPIWAMDIFKDPFIWMPMGGGGWSGLSKIPKYLTTFEKVAVLNRMFGKAVPRLATETLEATGEKIATTGLPKQLDIGKKMLQSAVTPAEKIAVDKLVAYGLGKTPSLIEDIAGISSGVVETIEDLVNKGDFVSARKVGDLFREARLQRQVGGRPPLSAEELKALAPEVPPVAKPTAIAKKRTYEAVLERTALREEHSLDLQYKKLSTEELLAKKDEYIKLNRTTGNLYEKDVESIDRILQAKGIKPVSTIPPVSTRIAPEAIVEAKPPVIPPKVPVSEIKAEKVITTPEMVAGKILPEKPYIQPEQLKQNTLFGLSQQPKTPAPPNIASDVQKEINVLEGFIGARTGKPLEQIRNGGAMIKTQEGYLKALRREADKVKVQDKWTGQLPFGLTTKEVSGQKPVYKTVKLSDIEVNPELLQPRDTPKSGVIQEKVDQIADNFDYDFFDPPKVIPHPDPAKKGKYLLYDGHHTLEGMRQRGLVDTVISIRNVSVEKARELSVVAGVSKSPLKALEAGKRFRIDYDKGLGLEGIKKKYSVEYGIGEIQKNVDLTYLSPQIQDMVRTKSLSVPHGAVIGKAVRENPTIFTPMVQGEIAIEFLGKEKGITPNVLENLIERLKPAIAAQMDLGFGVTEVKGFIRALSELHTAVRELSIQKGRLNGFLKIIKKAKKEGAEIPTEYLSASERAAQDVVAIEEKIATIQREGLKKFAPTKPAELSHLEKLDLLQGRKEMAKGGLRVSPNELKQIDRQATSQVIKRTPEVEAELNTIRGQPSPATTTTILADDIAEIGVKDPVSMRRALEDVGLRLPFETRAGMGKEELSTAIEDVLDKATPEKIKGLASWADEMKVGRQKYYQRTVPDSELASRGIKPLTGEQKLLAQPEPIPVPKNDQEFLREWKKLINKHDYLSAQQLADSYTGVTKAGRKRLIGYDTPNLKDIQTVRKKEYKARYTIEELKTINELPEKMLGDLFGTRWMQTFGRTAEEMGATVREWLYRIRNKTHTTIVRKKEFGERMEIMSKQLGVNSELSQRRIGTHAIWQEPDGQAILKASGIKPPTLTPKELEFYEWGRGLYDERLIELNKMRAYTGLEPINRRTDYFTHLMELNALEQMGFSSVMYDVDKLVAKGIHLNTPYFRFAKERVGGIKRLKTNYSEVLKQYHFDAIDHIELGRPIQQIREAINIPIKDVATGEKFNFREYAPTSHKAINEWLDFLAKQPAPSTPLSAKAKRILTTLNKNVAFSTLSYNIQSALIQPSAFLNSITVLGLRYSEGGIWDLMVKGSKEALQKSKVLEGRYFDVSIAELSGARGLWGKVGRAGTQPLRWLDQQTAIATWYGSYNKGIAEGLESWRAVRYADDIVIKTQASAARAEIAPLQRTAIGKTISMFQTFVINNWDFLRYEVFSNPQMSRLETAKRLAIYLAGSSMLNALYEDGLGLYSPFPSPVRASLRALAEGKGLVGAAWEIPMELAQVIPLIGGGVRYGSGFGGPALNIIDRTIRGKMGLVEGAMKLSGIPGTQQVKKTMSPFARSIKDEDYSPDPRDIYAGAQRTRINLLGMIWDALQPEEEEPEKTSELSNLTDEELLELYKKAE